MRTGQGGHEKTWINTALKIDLENIENDFKALVRYPSP